MEFCCTGEEPMRAILYKQRYIPAEGVGEPQICFGNEADLEVFHLDDMENVEMKNFLPTDLAYDMNFHILSFAPGASHSFVETHIQEHGMYILEGEVSTCWTRTGGSSRRATLCGSGLTVPRPPMQPDAPAIPTSIPRTATGTLPSDRFPQSVPSKKPLAN